MTVTLTESTATVTYFLTFGVTHPTEGYRDPAWEIDYGFPSFERATRFAVMLRGLTAGQGRAVAYAVGLPVLPYCDPADQHDNELLRGYTVEAYDGDTTYSQVDANYRLP